MRDGELIERLQSLYADGDKPGDLGGSSRDALWDLVSHNIGQLIDLAAEGFKKQQRIAKKATQSFVPDHFPGVVQKDWATAFWSERRRPDLAARVESIAEHFYDFHLGKGTKMLDWSACWRTWCRNQLEFAPNRSAMTTLAAAPVAFEQTNVEGWVSRLEVFEGLKSQPKGTWHPKWGPPPGDPQARVPGEARTLMANRHGRRTA